MEKTRRKKPAHLASLKDKLERMRKNIEETQKNELLTTNQYLEQMELILDILYEITILKRHTPSSASIEA